MQDIGISPRKRWANMPKAYGPWSVVHASLFENARKLGIDPNKIQLAMPLWERGGNVACDYAKNNCGDVLSGSWSDKGFIPGTGDNQPIALRSRISLASDISYTIIVSFVGNSFGSSTTMLLGNEDTDNYFGLRDTGTDIRVQDDGNNNLEDAYTFTVGEQYNLAYIQYGSAESLANYFSYVVNGVAQGIISSGVNPNPRFLIDSIGNGYTGTIYTLDGVISNVLIVEQRLSVEQIRFLRANPGYLWQPRKTAYYSVSSGITGTAAQTTAVVTQAATGEVSPRGSAAQTVAAIEQASTGSLGLPGVAAQDVAAVNQSATGVVANPVTGTAAQTVAEVSQSATGIESFIGAASQGVAEVVQSASGVHSSGVTGEAAQTVAEVEQAASGVVANPITGTAGQAVAPVSQAATGMVLNPITGTAAQTVADVSQAATGEAINPSTPEPEEEEQGGGYVKRYRRKKKRHEPIGEDSERVFIDEYKGIPDTEELPVEVEKKGEKPAEIEENKIEELPKPIELEPIPLLTEPIKQIEELKEEIKELQTEPEEQKFDMALMLAFIEART